MATVTQSTQEVTPSPSTHRPPGQRALKRMGDRVFSGLSTGSGIIILVILAMVAGFLLMQALPALITSPEVLSKQGYGPFWSWILPFAWGTVWCSFWALLMAVPVAIGIALFISHYAPRRLASGLGYVIDLLAAVPSVVFGLWGFYYLIPRFQSTFNAISDAVAGIPVLSTIFGPSTGSSYTTAALVLALMITLIITSVTREVFTTVPVNDKAGALALGATRWEMIRGVVFPTRPAA